MSSSDALIQSLIRAAELSTPDQGLEIKVIAPATPSPDANEQAYIDLRSRLVGKSRKYLDEDYQIWKAFRARFGDTSAWIKSTQESIDPNSPLFRRIKGFRVSGPTRWKFCEKCKGTGEGDIGYCRACEGNGYNV